MLLLTSTAAVLNHKLQPCIAAATPVGCCCYFSCSCSCQAPTSTWLLLLLWYHTSPHPPLQLQLPLLLLLLLHPQPSTGQAVPLLFWAGSTYDPGALWVVRPRHYWPGAAQLQAGSVHTDAAALTALASLQEGSTINPASPPSMLLQPCSTAAVLNNNLQPSTAAVTTVDCCCCSCPSCLCHCCCCASCSWTCRAPVSVSLSLLLWCRTVAQLQLQLLSPAIDAAAVLAALALAGLQFQPRCHLSFGVILLQYCLGKPGCVSSCTC